MALHQQSRSALLSHGHARSPTPYGRLCASSRRTLPVATSTTTSQVVVNSRYANCACSSCVGIMHLQIRNHTKFLRYASLLFQQLPAAPKCPQQSLPLWPQFAARPLHLKPTSMAVASPSIGCNTGTQCMFWTR